MYVERQQRPLVELVAEEAERIAGFDANPASDPAAPPPAFQPPQECPGAAGTESDCSRAPLGEQRQAAGWEDVHNQARNRPQRTHFHLQPYLVTLDGALPLQPDPDPQPGWTGEAQADGNGQQERDGDHHWLRAPQQDVQIVALAFLALAGAAIGFLVLLVGALPLAGRPLLTAAGGVAVLVISGCLAQLARGARSDVLRDNVGPE